MYFHLFRLLLIMPVAQSVVIPVFNRYTFSKERVCTLRIQPSITFIRFHSTLTSVWRRCTKNRAIISGLWNVKRIYTKHSLCETQIEIYESEISLCWICLRYVSIKVLAFLSFRESILYNVTSKWNWNGILFKIRKENLVFSIIESADVRRGFFMRRDFAELCVKLKTGFSEFDRTSPSNTLSTEEADLFGKRSRRIQQLGQRDSLGNVVSVRRIRFRASSWKMQLNYIAVTGPRVLRCRRY